MRCSKVTKFMSLYYDGALNDSVLSDIREHLDSCEACNTAYSSYESMAEVLSSSLLRIADKAPQYDTLPQQVSIALRAESSSAESHSIFTRIVTNLQPVPAFCTMLALLVIGLMLLFSDLMSSPTGHDAQVVSGKRTVFTVRPDQKGRVDTGYTSKRFARIEASETRHQR